MDPRIADRLAAIQKDRLKDLARARRWAGSPRRPTRLTVQIPVQIPVQTMAEMAVVA